MEFTNEIFFNKPLKAESTVIISYCGQLYREHSKDVSIVYGYGENWDYTDSAPMVETENGFEVTLTLRDYDIFNFCFTNSFNIWDNNFGNNYIASIAPKDDIEATFSSLLDSLLDDSKKDEEIDVSELSGFGLQSVDNIEEEDIVNCDEIFSELFDELTKDDNSNVQTIEESEEKETVQEFSQENAEVKENEFEELDDLMNNLLLSIEEDSDKVEDITPIEQSENLENSGLPLVQEKEDWLDKFINVSYNFTKKVITACKKFGTLVKIKAKEYGFISDRK